MHAHKYDEEYPWFEHCILILTYSLRNCKCNKLIYSNFRADVLRNNIFMFWTVYPFSTLLIRFSTLLNPWFVLQKLSTLPDCENCTEPPKAKVAQLLPDYT